MQTIGAIFAFLVGSVVGSFLNVCIYRLPKDESIISPRSHCPHCNHLLSAVDLIPIFGWFLLRGRCRYCGKPISGRYPLVEFLSAAMFVGMFFRFGLTAELVPALVIGAALLVVFFADLSVYIIPDQMVIAIALAGFALDIIGMVKGTGQNWTIPASIGGWSGRIKVPVSVVGFVFGGLVFLLLVLIFDRVFKRESMGYGDVKLAAAVGTYAWPGYPFLAFVILAVGLGFVAALPLMILGRKGRRDPIPFGPFLAVAAMALLVAQPQVVAIAKRIYPLH